MNADIKDLIRKIDDALLELNDAHKNGCYKWFDFKTALRLPDDKIREYGNNEYYKGKADQYAGIINDLLNTAAITVSIRYLSFDPQTNEVIFERSTYNSINGELNHEIIKQDVGDFRDDYLGLDYQDGNNKKTYTETKLEYLLRECKMDFSALGHDEDLTDFLKRHNSVFIASKCAFPDISMDAGDNHAFEGYIKQLKEDRALNNEYTDDKWIDEAVKLLISNGIIPAGSAKNMRNLLTNGKSGIVQVNDRKFTAFSKIAHPLWEQNKIPHTTFSFWTSLICSCIRQNGNEIPASTISDAIHGERRRNSAE